MKEQDDLTAQVAITVEVIAQGITKIQADLAALTAAAANQADPAVLTKLTGDLKTSTDALLAAITPPPAAA